MRTDCDDIPIEPGVYAPKDPKNKGFGVIIVQENGRTTAHSGQSASDETHRPYIRLRAPFVRLVPETQVKFLKKQVKVLEAQLRTSEREAAAEYWSGFRFGILATLFVGVVVLVIAVTATY